MWDPLFEEDSQMADLASNDAPDAPAQPKPDNTIRQGRPCPRLGYCSCKKCRRRLAERSAKYNLPPGFRLH
jgi:hypothetical protein